MSKATIKINKQDLRGLNQDIDKAIDRSAKDTYKFFKQTTPIDSGNARRKTRFKDTPTQKIINADYPYADRLDKGWSKQAPKGMIEPSIEYFEQQLSRRFGDI